MRKLRLTVSAFVIICIGSGASYGNDAARTDAQVMEKAVLKLKKSFPDKKISNINKLAEAFRPPNMACECLFIVPLNDKGEWDEDEDYDNRMVLSFDDTPNYDYSLYGYSGHRYHITRKFMEQVNKKLSKRVLLKNFIQKDLIVTLEYADGDKVVFDGYYNRLRELNVPRPPAQQPWKSGAATVTRSGGTLRVKGVGAMRNYAGDPPWHSVRNSITALIIENGVTHIGDGAFAGFGKLKSVTIPNSVTTIGNGVFGDCAGLTSVTIPRRVTAIGILAFSGCTGLTSVTIPNSVTSIGFGAFSGCTGLTSITVPGSVAAIGDKAFSGCAGLTSVTIENGVKSIGRDAFEYCTGLTSITIPGSVAEIKRGAFSHCDDLASVTIRHGVTAIGEYAFFDCTDLASVTIPGSVTTIGHEAFSGSAGLISVTSLNPVPPGIGRDVFDGLPAGACLYVPAHGIDAYRAADEWKKFKCVEDLESAGSKQAQTADPPKIITGVLVDSRDGKKYRTVKIGGKTWMAENLNFETGNSGCYENDEGNCQKYGRLYDWETAVKACPAGWRLSSRQDWEELISAAGGSDAAGRKLKSTTGWEECGGAISGNGKDIFGFSALPGGYRNIDNSTFSCVGRDGNWWSATGAYKLNMRSCGKHVVENDGHQGRGLSVRCVEK